MDPKFLRHIFMEMGLTHRQAEVASLAAGELQIKEMGIVLFIGPKAVKYHLTKIYKITNTSGRNEFRKWLKEKYLKERGGL